MHGNDNPGLQLVHKGLGLGGINGVVAAHRNEYSGQPLQFLLLLGGQLAAQITKMGNTAIPVIQDMNGIGAAQRALLVIVPGGVRMVNGEAAAPWRSVT